MERKIFKGDTSHGSAWDRGSSDSYYRRIRQPHIWTFEESTLGKTKTDITPQQILEYHLGFEDNELWGDKKDWG